MKQFGVFCIFHVLCRTEKKEEEEGKEEGNRWPRVQH